MRSPTETGKKKKSQTDCQLLTFKEGCAFYPVIQYFASKTLKRKKITVMFFSHKTHRFCRMLNQAKPDLDKKKKTKKKKQKKKTTKTNNNNKQTKQNKKTKQNKTKQNKTKQNKRQLVKPARENVDNRRFTRINEHNTGKWAGRQKPAFVCWLLYVPATCVCISGTELLIQLYVLPH